MTEGRPRSLVSLVTSFFLAEFGSDRRDVVMTMKAVQQKSDICLRWVNPKLKIEIGAMRSSFCERRRC